MTWLTIKAKLYALGAGILVIIASLARFKMVKDQRDRALDRAASERARADQAEDIAAADAEIESEFSDLERESKRDIEAGKMPRNIRDRNKF